MSEEAYLRELSDLGRRHGLGLMGQICFYLLEPEDMAFDYTADAEGIVRLGSPGDADADAGSRARRDAQGSLNARAPANV